MARETRSIVDQDVDPAQCGRCSLDIARDCGFVGEIADRGMRGAAVQGDLLAGGGEPLGAAGADRHAGAGLGKGECDGAADAAAAAGDDRPLAGKVDIHASS
jgi:hypothetical protein